MKEPNKLFGELFKKFRLRAGFESLSALANVLADEGLVFDDSTLSRWQNGNRIPRKRKLLVQILKLFVNYGGISKLEEANFFMEAANLGRLTEKEIRKISEENILLTSPFQVPARLKSFVGRQQEIKEISEKLINTKNVVISCISGLGGIGKTALAIHLGYKLRPFFPDGILWSRMDISTPNDVLNKIALSYKQNVASIESLQTKAEIVRSLLFNKKALLVFDNTKNAQKLTFLLPNSSSCSVLITTRNKNIARAIHAEQLCLQPFKRQESYQLFKKVVGSELLSKKEIDKISKTLGFLPLALSITAYQIKNTPNWRTQSILKSLNDEWQRLDQLEIDSIGVRTSFNMSYKKLDSTLKKFFQSLAVFSGEDFSIKAALAINKVNKKAGEKILEKFVDKSLIERSSPRRYRLHPLMKLFAQELIRGKNFYRAACNYFISVFSKEKNNLKKYDFIRREFDNILGLFNWALKNEEHKLALQIWKDLGVFLWDCGYWPETYKLGKKAYTATRVLKDKKAQANYCLKLLCWVCFWQDKIKEAEKFANKGLKSAKTLKDKYLLMFAKKRLGMIYKEQKRYRKALKALRECLSFFKKTKRVGDSLDALTYIGHVFYEQKKLKNAVFYYKKALKLANKIDDKMGKSILLNSLAKSYSDLEHFELAEEYYKKNFSAAKRARSLPAIFWNRRGFGFLQFKRGNLEKAHELLSEAYEKGRRLGLTKELEKIKKVLKKIEEKTEK